MVDLSPYDFIENEGMPPLSNRGAQSTLREGLKACVDWLQVTLHPPYEISFILDLMGLENTQFLECTGKYGYKKGLTNNGISIYYDGLENMGIHLQLSGSGCRFLENIVPSFSWVEFFNGIHSTENYNVTRIDIALDDFHKKLSIPALKNKLKKGECISKFKDARPMETIKIKDGSSKGNTIYFGQPTSQLQVRFYEKNHEMKNKGHDPKVEFWNRYEIQLRKKRAMELFKVILLDEEENFKNVVKGVLNNYIRFVNKDNNSNKSKWKTYRPWELFIKEVDKIKLTHSEMEKDIFDSYNHIKEQYAPTLAMLHNAGITDFTEIIEEGKRRLKDIHYKKIAEFKKKRPNDEGRIEK